MKTTNILNIDEIVIIGKYTEERFRVITKLPHCIYELVKFKNKSNVLEPVVKVKKHISELTKVKKNKSKFSKKGIIKYKNDNITDLIGKI